MKVIGVRTQYEFRQVATATDAAMLLATEGGELCALVDRGFGWGSQQYADAPAEWVAAVEAVSAAPEFQAAVSAKKAAMDAEDKRAAARNSAMDAANAEYSRVSGAISADLRGKVAANIADHRAAYAAAVAAHGDVVCHGFIAEQLAEMEKLANGPREFAVTDDAVISAVRAGKSDSASIAAAVGAQDADEAFMVARKIASLVAKKKLNKDRRDRITVAA